MARAHFVKKARKDNPAVKAGESYWWWQFAYRDRQYSKTQPKQSQLTQSSFLSELYSIQGDIELIVNPENLPEIMDRIDELRDECENSLENMPEQLQETSDSGIMLDERITALGDWHTELDGIDIDPGDLKDEDLTEWLEETLDEIKGCSVFL